MSDSSGNRSAPEAKGIVLTHGSMCYGMVDAVRKISGADEDALEAVSNEGQGPDQLMQMVMRAAGDGPAIIFTDLQTGSCALTARFVCRDPGNRRAIFGANLPMLLDFVFHRALPLDELVDRLLEQGRTAIHSFDTERSPDGHRTSAGG